MIEWRQIMEDVSGVQFTQSQGFEDSYRWFAPELCFEPNVFSTKSDVFSFGMTALEVRSPCSLPYRERTSKLVFHGVTDLHQRTTLRKSQAHPRRPREDAKRRAATAADK